MGVKEEKAALRKECAALRDALPLAERERRNKKICSLCASLAVFRFAQAVLLYHPIRSEVDVRPLLEMALAEEKEVYLPLCDKEISGKMQFHRVFSPDELHVGAFGVMEPDENAPLWQDDEKRAVCLIPALAYGKNGHRLGYGKGYYDRFVSTFKGTGIGLTYSELLLPFVPHNRFDLRVDLVITEKGVFLTREV
ncbi:MAG: 5-formyltetrahydrofolate cyclo-ligase [Ruminococcaceae bacterium]|nr:5-formyltetrahydrofolate cyclo-ligase [Oscillospiraceae bacterium]